MKNIFLTVISMFVISNLAVAGSEKVFSVEGEITKFTQDKVTLRVNGKSVDVPRGAIPTYYSVKTGYKVIAYLPSETVLAGKKKK